MFEGQEALTEADALHPAVREAGVGEAPIEQDGPLYRSRPRACAQTLTTCAISLSGFAQAATEQVNIEPFAHCIESAYWYPACRSGCPVTRKGRPG
jgi:hypothetical protein